MKNEITKEQARVEIVQGLVRGFEAAKSSDSLVYVLASRERRTVFGWLVRLSLSPELYASDEVVVDSFDHELCDGDVWPVIPSFFDMAERTVDKIF